MDFLGIGKRTSKAAFCETDAIMNASALQTEMDFLAPPKPSEQPLPENKKTSVHYLSRVKPQMMQQVLLFRGIFDEKKEVSPPNHGHVKGSGDGEVMELFPQHAGCATTKPVGTVTSLPLPSLRHHHLTGTSARQLQDRSLLTSSGVGALQPASTRSGSAATPPHKQSSTQLTIFYNGTVNVYDVPADKAQTIMNMLAENGNSHQLDPDPEFNEGAACTTASCPSDGPLIWKPETPSSQSEAPTPPLISEPTTTTGGIKDVLNLRRGGLPLARKQSLQRFLEKRRDRLNSVAPYGTNGTLAKNRVEQKVDFPRDVAVQKRA